MGSFAASGFLRFVVREGLGDAATEAAFLHDDCVDALGDFFGSVALDSADGDSEAENQN